MLAQHKPFKSDLSHPGFILPPAERRPTTLSGGHGSRPSRWLVPLAGAVAVLGAAQVGLGLLLGNVLLIFCVGTAVVGVVAWRLAAAHAANSWRVLSSGPATIDGVQLRTLLEGVTKHARDKAAAAAAKGAPLSPRSLN